MHTNKKITFSALNSHYLNTDTMTINTEYLCDAIIIWADNTKYFYDCICNNRKKIQSVVWNAFISLTNNHIRDNEYPYNQDYYASNDQLKKWLFQYGNGYDTLKSAIDTLQNRREEYSK